MKQILLGVGLVVAVLIIGLIFLDSSDSMLKEEVAFHITLADPGLYSHGVYQSSLDINEGKYFFRFVPNGDSPKILSISVVGEDLNFSEEFELIGTPHDTGISEYYTWDYDGQKTIVVPEKQKIEISINPNGDLIGPVSVDLVLK